MKLQIVELRGMDSVFQGSGLVLIYESALILTLTMICNKDFRLLREATELAKTRRERERLPS
jgi:hypothetical protein